MTQEEYDRYVEEMERLARSAQEASHSGNYNQEEACWNSFAERAHRALGVHSKEG